MSRLRSALDRVTKGARATLGREVWIVDRTSDGDGLAYRRANEPGLTLEQFAALPDDRDRTLVEIVDEAAP